MSNRIKLVILLTCCIAIAAFAAMGDEKTPAPEIPALEIVDNPYIAQGPQKLVFGVRQLPDEYNEYKAFDVQYEDIALFYDTLEATECQASIFYDDIEIRLIQDQKGVVSLPAYSVIDITECDGMILEATNL